MRHAPDSIKFKKKRHAILDYLKYNYPSIAMLCQDSVPGEVSAWLENTDFDRRRVSTLCEMFYAHLRARAGMSPPTSNSLR